MDAPMALITMLFSGVKQIHFELSVVIYSSAVSISAVILMGFDDISELASETSIGTIRIRILNLENGLLILFSEKEQYRLGISAVAIPPGQGRSEPTSTALFTMGLDAMLVRTIAERISSWTNNTCMVVSGLTQLNRDIMMQLLSFLRDHLVA
jgi:hypothetical protein